MREATRVLGILSSEVDMLIDIILEQKKGVYNPYLDGKLDALVNVYNRIDELLEFGE